jgi:ABC-type sugar transport system substrate-binding protein
MAALCAASAIGLTACGSSSGTSADGATPTTGAVTGQLAKQAQAAAAKAGSPTTLRKITIGYLRYVAQSPADQRIYNAAVAAANTLGWKVIQCDGQGDPVKMASCGNSLLDQKIDVLLTDGIPQTIIASALQRAKSMGIPAVYSGGSQDQADLYTAGYVPPDGQMGEVLAKYVADQTKGKSGGVIVQGFPAGWGKERVDALKAAGVNIAAEKDADATNLVQGTQQQIAAQLNEHADASAVWITFETAVLGASQALAAKFPGKSYPDRPLLVTFYANQPTLQLIGQGKVDAAVEDALEWSSWVAVDQIAEWVARKAPMSTDLRPNYGDGLDFWRPTLVTKENLPKAGSLVAPPVDYAGFFQAKWKTEFNAAN